MEKKICELASTRLLRLIYEKEENIRDFYQGHETFLSGLKEEIQEAQDEIKENNSIYLEDELGDVFWDYVCLLEALKNEGKITSVEKVFERCYEKFSGRICSQTGKNVGEWSEVKQKQKEKLKKEHDNLYNN